jgi:hypothetical protein
VRSGFHTREADVEFWKWMAATAAVTLIAGCASAPARHAPDAQREAPDGAPAEREADPDEATGSGEDEDDFRGGKDDLEGGSKAPQRHPTASDSPSDGGGVGDPRVTVDALAAELEQQVGSYREDFGVESGADYGRDAALTCGDICDVKSAICTSSSKICTISRSYPGDEHIQGRCTWATAECGKAEDACTKCR